MDFIKSNWKQALVIVASVVLALLVHFHVLSSDAAVVLASVLAGFGIHLPAVSYKDVQPPPGGAAVLLVGSMVIGSSVALAGCPAATPVVAPAATLAVCIVDQALAGKSLADIVTACGSDVPAVVAAIVHAADPAILATRAHSEAIAIQAVLRDVDAGAK